MGKTLILQVGNPSTTNQVGVQFIQTVETANVSKGSNAAVSLFQRTNPNTKSTFDGTTTLTAWMSAHADVIAEAGLKTGYNYRANGEEVDAEEVFGADIQIACIENTFPNPASPSLKPKSPGVNSMEVITLNGEPVYRHTGVVIGTPNATSIPGFDPDEQCEELNGRYFLTSAVTQRMPKADFPEIYEDVRNPTQLANIGDAF